MLTQSLSKDYYEIIIINDRSNDQTSYILNLFKEDIVVIDNKKNIGLPASLNKGIKQSKGKYIVRVDSDDYVNSNFLLFLLEFIKQNEDYNCDAVACDYLIVDDEEKIVLKKSSKKNPIGCGILFRKKDLKSIGLYDKRLFLCEERELISRFKKKFTLGFLNIPLYRYRRHRTNITNNKKKLQFFKKMLKESQ